MFQINTKLITDDEHHLHHLNDTADNQKLKMNSFPTTSTTEFIQMNEMKHLSTLKITYSREDIQYNWPIHLFKIFQVKIYQLFLLLLWVFFIM